jgi:hypothetical protein
MSLSFKVSVHRWLLIARMSPKTDTPSKNAHNHQDQRKKNPLRRGPPGRPEKGHQGEFRIDGIVLRVDLDNVGDGGTPSQLLPLLAGSVRVGGSRHCVELEDSNLELEEARCLCRAAVVKVVPVQRAQQVSLEKARLFRVSLELHC